MTLINLIKDLNERKLSLEVNLAKIRFLELIKLLKNLIDLIEIKSSFED